MKDDRDYPIEREAHYGLPFISSTKRDSRNPNQLTEFLLSFFPLDKKGTRLDIFLIKPPMRVFNQELKLLQIILLRVQLLLVLLQ